MLVSDGERDVRRVQHISDNWEGNTKSKCCSACHFDRRFPTKAVDQDTGRLLMVTASSDCVARLAYSLKSSAMG